MKRIYFALTVAAAMLLSACSKQEDDKAANGEVPMTFYGAIEQTDTKTTLTNDLKVNWQAGDVIMVKGTERDAQEFRATPDEDNLTKATFTGYLPISELLTSPYQAYYPSELWEGKTRLFKLPAVQYYNPGRFDAPMYAESDDENFQFHNLCGVLHFALKGKYCSIGSIAVEAVDEVVFGSFSVSNGKDIHMTPGSYSNKVTLQVTSAVPLNSETATDFYIYLPPQTYKAGMTITITNTQSTKYIKTTTKDFVVERNKIYTFNWDVTPKSGKAKARIGGKDVDVPWVELWENGPKFAKYNLGVTDGKESSVGGYYTQESDLHFKDRVTEVWGANWRTPTKDELKALLDNCTAEDVTIGEMKGALFTGKGSYSVNSIFLPYNGWGSYEVGDLGRYATSTPINVSIDWYRHYFNLHVANGRKVIESGNPYDAGTGIRPVAIIEDE